MLRLDQEKDPETLRRAALLLEQENRKLIDKVVELQRRLLAAQGRDPSQLAMELERLEQQLAQRNQELFGRSSEKREGPASEPAAAPPPGPLRADGKPKRPGHGPRPQLALPVV